MSDVFRRLQLMVAKGVALLVGTGRVQAQVMADEVLPNIERVEPYGLSYMPHAGAQAYIVFPRGDRSHGFALVLGDKQYNMRLEPGEVALHDDEGNFVHIKRGGEIEVAAQTKIVLRAPLVELDGMAVVSQGLTVLGAGADGEAESSIAGNLSLNVSALTVNGKNMSETHTHEGVMAGGDRTGGVH
jgi:phage baseplate assembly protein V